MIPIYEQGKGQGIGHHVTGFNERFDDICNEHLRSGRAKAFAFIFYDFEDRDFRSLLKDTGFFVKLDRLAGSDLSIFFLHARERRTIDAFNRKFLEVLKVPAASLPCITFFRLDEGLVKELQVVPLENASLIHGLDELSTIIRSYKEGLQNPQTPPLYIRLFRSTAKFIGLETFRALLKETLHHVLKLS